MEHAADPSTTSGLDGRGLLGLVLLQQGCHHFLGEGRLVLQEAEDLDLELEGVLVHQPVRERVDK